MRRIAVLLCALGISSPALCGTVGGYPDAGTLNGTERILADQSASGYPCTSCTVDITPVQISAYVVTQSPAYGVVINNGGVIGGIVPGSSGTYCFDWTSINAPPTLVSCPSGSSATFQANGTNLSNQTTVNFENSATTNGLTLGFLNPSAGNVQLTLSGTLANAGLANSSLTFNGQNVSLGASGNVNNGAAQYSIALNGAAGAAIGGIALPGSTGLWCIDYTSLTANPTLAACPSGGITLQTGGTNNASQTTLNLVGTGNVAVTNPSGSTVDIGPVSEPVNAQTGTTYTIATTDCGKQIAFNNASAIAVTVPQANGSFATCQLDVTDLGAGTATLTPTTSTINGSSTLAVAQNRQCTVNSDGTNWQVIGCTALVSSTSVVPMSGSASSVAQATNTDLMSGISGGNIGAISPVTGTIKNLYVRVTNAPASGQTYTFTMLVGTWGSASATAVTCQISNPNTSCSDTSDTASVAVGNQYVLNIVTSATSGSTGQIGWGFEFDH